MEGDPRILVERASQGEAGAVERLLEKYLPDLRVYLQRRAGWAIRAKESGEDLAQSCCREVLERLADGRFRFQGEAQFRQWLYQAALLKIRDRERHWKADKRDVRREQRPMTRPSASAARFRASLFRADGTPSQAAAHHEEQELLEQAFDRLPERYQEILMLAHVEGLSHREIGERLAVTAEHSRVLLSRGLAQLSRLAAEIQDREAGR